MVIEQMAPETTRTITIHSGKVRVLISGDSTKIHLSCNGVSRLRKYQLGPDHKQIELKTTHKINTIKLGTENSSGPNTVVHLYINDGTMEHNINAWLKPGKDNTIILKH